MTLVQRIYKEFIAGMAFFGIALSSFIGFAVASGNFRLEYDTKNEIAQDYKNNNADKIAQCKDGKLSAEFSQTSRKTITLFGQTAIAQHTDHLLNQNCDPSHLVLRDRFYAALGRQLVFTDAASNPAYAEAYRRLRRVTDEIFDTTINNNQKQPLEKSVADLNVYINHNITYQLDEENNGARDYMSSAAETAFNHKGDCEDYAILKYQLLKDAGVPVKNMFIVFVSLPEKNDIDHAILMVNVAAENEKPRFMALDNNYNILISMENALYKPYFALNDQGSWTFAHNLKDPEMVTANAAHLKQDGRKPT